MIIKSDWHIHSKYSYDAKIPLKEIIDNANSQGLKAFGITDHLNFNDDKFLADIKASVENVTRMQQECSKMVLGVELTTISKDKIDYIAKHGTRDGYVDPEDTTAFGLELALSKQELKAMGIRYAVGAAHWRLDKPALKKDASDLDGIIKDWYRQQMWLAEDERTTILGHPWYNGMGVWYEDFSVIPPSMNNEIAHAVKQNGKHVECNAHFFTSDKATEKFRHQYSEFLRELFEMGIKITYGSDAHNKYDDERECVEKYLSQVGFKDGDFYDLTEKDFW